MSNSLCDSISSTWSIVDILKSNDKIFIEKLYTTVINHLTKTRWEKDELCDYGDNDKNILQNMRDNMLHPPIFMAKPTKGLYTYLADLKYNNILSTVIQIKNNISKSRLNNIKQQFTTASNNTNGTVLDVGCLDENLSKQIFIKLNGGIFRNCIKNMHGIDIKNWSGGPGHIADHNKDKNASLTFNTVENEYSTYPYSDNKFSLITCFNVLHHIENPEFLISELYRVTAHGGYVIIKEHDIRNENEAKLCYMSHIIRQHILSDNRSSSVKCWFKNKHMWNKLYKKHKFVVLSHFYQKNSSLRSYSTILQKQ
jgi:2-polyprenyl-3-methyl-5-hydroxy-6-metoxy-1,4-benzoquinol methylase